MKLHWVGEWKEGKSWNNPMKSEGWALLWARVHGEGGRAENKKRCCLLQQGNGWDTTDKHNSNSPRDHKVKVQKKEPPQPKQAIPMRTGMISMEISMCLRHAPAWGQKLLGRMTPVQQQCWAATSQGHFLPTFPVHKHRASSFTNTFNPTDCSWKFSNFFSQFTKVFLYIRSTSISKYLPHFISRNKRQGNEM